MTDDDLRRALLALPAPEEEAAGARAWPTVRAAFASREPVAWPVRHARPLIALAVAGALIAAAFTPPGEAVVNEVRDAIGRERTVGVRQAREALFSLPAPGRALVESGRGLWVVRPDGSRRLLGRYRDGAWSPHGLYLAAVRGNELTALDDRGTVRWSLPRSGLVGSPSWTGTRTDTRIAYLAGPVPRRELRVVAGDGTGDRLLARRVAPVAPAWRPGSGRELAFILRSGRLLVMDADTGAVRWRVTADPKSDRLAWSDDGRRLLVAESKRIRLFAAGGRLLRTLTARPGNFFLDASFRPGGRGFAYTLVHPLTNRSRVFAFDGRALRQLFAGSGSFVELAWSPDGRWLSLGWPEADQWVFLRAPGVRKIQAVSNVSRQFGSGGRITGWCCAPSR
jgi:outer membrane protein assembly factor BamB